MYIITTRYTGSNTAFRIVNLAKSFVAKLPGNPSLSESLYMLDLLKHVLYTYSRLLCTTHNAPMQPYVHNII